MGQGTSKESETVRSWGRKVECGVNTWRRCSSKAVAFSESLFAQPPSDVRTGVMDTWGRLKPLVAFQREMSSGERDVIYVSKVAFRASLKAACKSRFRRL
jgi:hypothetical protein